MKKKVDGTHNREIVENAINRSEHRGFMEEEIVVLKKNLNTKYTILEFLGGPNNEKIRLDRLDKKNKDRNIIEVSINELIHADAVED